MRGPVLHLLLRQLAAHASLRPRLGQKYRDHGLVVIGAHSPEFPFEHDVEKVRAALEAMGVDYPIAVDNDFAVWRAFDNHVLARPLLRRRRGANPASPLRRGGLRAVGAGHPAAAGRGRSRRGRRGTWSRSSPAASSSRRTGRPCGRRRPTSATSGPTGFASPGGLVPTAATLYGDPRELGPQPVVALGRLDGGRTDQRAERARRADHLSLSRPRPESRAGLPGRREPVRFLVRIDGEPPGEAPRASTSTIEGNGTIAEARLYQLVRQPGADHGPHLRDHVPRSGRAGLRVHLRLIGGRVRVKPVASTGAPHTVRGMLGSGTFRLEPPRLRTTEDPSSERHATWFELFDLVFAAAVVELATSLADDPTSAVFGRFAALSSRSRGHGPDSRSTPTGSTPTI